MRSRRSLRAIALAGLATAAVFGTASGAQAKAGCPCPPPPSSSTALYWGTFQAANAESEGTQLKPFPVSVPGRITRVGSSNSAVYALLADGSLYAWGIGTDGQLGDGKLTDSLTTAVKVRFPAGVKITSIPDDVMPYNEGLAVDTTGHVWGWGTNPFGDALCLGTTATRPIPVRLSFTHVTATAGAFGHALYASGGKVYACGGNFFGELGDGTRKPSSTPVAVKLPTNAKVAQLVAAWTNSGALLTDGTYYNWGYNRQGQLGQGTTGGSSSLPVKVDLPGPAKQVSQGGSLPNNGQTLALLANGELYAWGNGHRYQLGTGTRASQPLPEHVILPSGVHLRTVASGGSTSYGITANGDVYAWGNNLFGQVGDGTRRVAKSPVLVAHDAVTISTTNADVVANVRNHT